MTTPSVVTPRPATEPTPASGLNRETLLALSERRGEPQWLHDSRLEGWTAFEDLPLPKWTKGIAQWWSTDVSELDLSKTKVSADKLAGNAGIVVRGERITLVAAELGQEQQMGILYGATHRAGDAERNEPGRSVDIGHHAC